MMALYRAVVMRGVRSAFSYILSTTNQGCFTYEILGVINAIYENCLKAEVSVAINDLR